MGLHFHDSCTVLGPDRQILPFIGIAKMVIQLLTTISVTYVPPAKRLNSMVIEPKSRHDGAVPYLGWILQQIHEAASIQSTSFGQTTEIDQGWINVE